MVEQVDDLVSAGIDEDPEEVSGAPVSDATALGEYAAFAQPENALRLDGDD